MRISEVNELQSKIKQIKQFADWAIHELDIEREPTIDYGTDLGRVKSQRSFGSTNSAGKIWVHCLNRNAADAMRTLCHELVHHRQFEIGTATNDMDDEQRLQVEDEANAIAGRMMRAYGKQHESIYESKGK
jgi:Zn-dependent peptidase ImmA (M78 family)